MSLGISIKDEEKKNKIPDITQWPREYLEKKYTQKRKLLKYIMIGAIIISIMLVWNTFKLTNAQWDLDSANAALSACVADNLKDCMALTNATLSAGTSTTGVLVESITSFFTWITHLDQPYFYRIMILLGILYLIQIIFAVVVDFVEVVLLVFVLIKRGVMWIAGMFIKKKEGSLLT